MKVLLAYRDPWLSIAIMLAASFWALHVAEPDQQMAVHFGLDGVPDRFMPLAIGAFILPAILFALTLLMIFLPQLDPKLKGTNDIPPELASLARVLTGGLGMIHLGLLALAFHLIYGMESILHVSLGYLFIGTGNLLGKVRPNFFVGIRTPWTLSDDDVWRRTHRAGGWGMVLIGFGFLAGAFPGAPPISARVLLATLVTYSLSLTVYSYVLWRGRQTHGGQLE